mgnify:CR=1 FL=1
MKKLIYLFVAAIMFAFIACGGGETGAEDTTVACGYDCQKSCCLGCQATKGDAKCIVLEDGSMPCCIAKALEEDYDHEEHGHDHEEHGHDH